MGNTRIKVCGHRELASVVAAAEAGADFVGFVFVPGSKRRLPRGKEQDVIEAFRKMREGKTPRLVGVFADQSLEDVTEAARRFRLEVVQLCGHEDTDYCARVRVPVIKVLHVKAGKNDEKTIEVLDKEMARLNEEGLGILLDRQEPGLFGGSGKSFDWRVAQELAARGHQFMLAGGLEPDNVGEAIRDVQPWGVDVSSGVETGGVKDIKKIAAFIREVQDAERRNRVDRLRSALEMLTDTHDAGDKA